ncbi:conserved exported hypothetical protein [Vibrio chagasii]|uniref:hypothetical protein n=2 Tax=unclassified Vibrio TaxID=2614977 RepID=UPI0010BD9AE2|nr:hypothetical protein [Vibrio sp. F12]CAH6892524.1 conserved exported hypothetical protein [Vibrio chagasii]TKE92350.1 hypothetical protein FCV53_08640 [Vibrio sp. F12]CAH6903815.1 conserved exported hypothetical protein [Vibrio chagasii]CAH6907957.1 conserved exported hypothetical protein [Vibrio chagasii]CAH6961996.1 conserved exported hypothetical protein [Vibrio chagasii]
MKFLTSLCLLALTVSFNSHANTDSAEQLYAVNQDYAKCLDVLLGNFKSDAEAQEAMSKFYKALIANTEQILELQLQANDEGMLAFLEVLHDRKVLLGYMVAKMSEPDIAFEAEKAQLKEAHSFDWKLVHQELWRTNGCNAIYGSLD